MVGPPVTGFGSSVNLTSDSEVLEYKKKYVWQKY